MLLELGWSTWGGSKGYGDLHKADNGTKTKTSGSSNRREGSRIDGGDDIDQSGRIGSLQRLSIVD